ncbi:hypothetical protein [Streptococcus catagoni]|uniref:hypothetical protein n=1 Tax=Streptococcus catagoni TaxID=2654874 RepID=UPI001407C194|nr:hypothetical protein [Streptococcus catagoni]
MLGQAEKVVSLSQIKANQATKESEELPDTGQKGSSAISFLSLLPLPLSALVWKTRKGEKED